MSDGVSNKVVLVVEDEPLLLMLAVNIIEDAGYDVITAVDADKALDLLCQRTDIQIVFTDIDMPGAMDGLKLAAAVRDRWPPIEIIITSGEAKRSQITLPARGVFMPKPYSAALLTNALHRLAA